MGARGSSASGPSRIGPRAAPSRPSWWTWRPGDRHVFLLVQIAPEAHQRAWLRVVAYEIADGEISGAQVFEGDPAAADSYFHAGGTA